MVQQNETSKTANSAAAAVEASSVATPPIEATEVVVPPDLLAEIDIDAITQNLAGLEGKVDSKAKTAAVILAGGSGERFGRDGGKQLVEIAGKPMLTWAAEAFDAVGDIGLIVVVCPEERMDEYLATAIDPFPFVTPVTMAPAGSIRQESAFSPSPWSSTGRS